MEANARMRAALAAGHRPVVCDGRNSHHPDCESSRLAGIGSQLITVWLEVRVLPGPPRTLPNREISRRRPRSPQLAGSCGCVSVSAETVSGLNVILGGL